ncbi:MAG: hypothetical protein QOE62_563 [Actinomycetota bacterium]|jgi:hypothetical protein|nr:hypothetical protein [Actinomycetota bacterium]
MSKRTTRARPNGAKTPPPRNSALPQPSAADAPLGARLGVKIAAFVTLVVVCAMAGVAYVIHARAKDPKAGKPREPSEEVTPARLAALMSAPHLLFENTDLGPAYGRVEVVPLNDPGGVRAITPITCDRVATAKNVGVCLTINRGVITTYEGKIFDRSFRVLHTFALPGLPSRARLSPDGHWAAMTVFVSGDNYASATFSTRTSFIDTSTGKNLGNLEQFHVTDGGSTVTSANRNYWGVTFAADSDHFFATLGRGSKIRLIAGSVSSRSAHTIRNGVECPSLSPDQTRIAYKSRVGGTLTAVKWRLHVVDLRTGADIALAETRSVDDQVEWLDNNTILYSILRSETGTAIKDTYAVPADGSGQPTIYVKGAWSPAVGARTAS